VQDALISLRTLFRRKDDPPIWPDLAEKHVYHLTEGLDMTVLCIEGGMKSGKPSVTLRIDLPNGAVVVAETSARLFCIAAHMIQARHPDLFEGD
jgi:hypothetical protein